METKCANPNCKNTVSETRQQAGSVTCSWKCTRYLHNKRYRDKKKGLGEISDQQNLTMNPMENENQNTKSKEENFALKILAPGSSSMPSPSNDPTITYFIHDLKEKLSLAVREIDKWQDKAENLKEKVLDKDREIADLKHSIEKMQDERNAKSGLSGILDDLRNENGAIDFAGLGQMASSIISSLKTSSPSQQLTGMQVPDDVKEFVEPIAAWMASLQPEQRENAWTVINAMATNTEYISYFINSLQNGQNVRKAAN